MKIITLQKTDNIQGGPFNELIGVYRGWEDMVNDLNKDCGEDVFLGIKAAKDGSFFYKDKKNGKDNFYLIKEMEIKG